MLELAVAFDALAEIDVSSSFNAKARALGRVHREVKQLKDAQSKTDFAALALCVDEWTRIASSMKAGFANRSKAKVAWQNADNALGRKKETLEKLLSSKVSRNDKIASTNEEIKEVS